jgi:hypothetical protein
MSGGIFPAELLQGLASAATLMAPAPPNALPQPDAPAELTAQGAPQGALPPGGLPQGDLTTTAVPNLADASLGGAIGGPMGAATKAAAAGGIVPDNLDMGGVV